MIIFRVLLIAFAFCFPSVLFSNAKMGGDFSEDYFKKFGVDKVFQCNELDREKIKKEFSKYTEGNLKWGTSTTQKICDRNISFLKDKNGENYINLTSGVGDGIGNKYDKEENSIWNDFKMMERRRFEFSSTHFDFSHKSFTLEYDIRIPKKHKFIGKNDSLGIGQLHSLENDAIWRFFLMETGYWVMGVKVVEPEDYDKWNNIKIVINNYPNNYGLIIIVNGEILQNIKSNNENLMWAEYKKDKLYWKIGLYQQKIYEDILNPDEQSVDLKNIKSSVHDEYIEY